MQAYSTSSGILTVDLSALGYNYQLLQKTVGQKCGVAGIVKADAYGLGMAPIVKKLTELNCPQFFVATLEEALALRKINTDTPVAVLNGLYHGAEKEYLAHNIMPVLNSLEEIMRWKKQAKDTSTPMPAIIHFDTGMNRLGLGTKETERFFDSPTFSTGLDIKMLLSHFSCADEKENILTFKQNEKFKILAEKFPAAQKSIANSSGVFRDKIYHHDIVRPGYALYGGNPTPETNNPMKPVVKLAARILQVNHVERGESVGYGATHIFDNSMTIATVALGYADGFMRSGSAATTLYWRGKPCPVLGRISMDLVSVDLSALADSTPQTGHFMDILGPHQNIDGLADDMRTIGYEILTSFGARYQREYV